MMSDLFRQVTAHFNPRSREGSDLRDLARKRRSNEFQSTLPRRERPAVLDQLGGDRHFNPRSREGSDTQPQLWGVL